MKQFERVQMPSRLERYLRDSIHGDRLVALRGRYDNLNCRMNIVIEPFEPPAHLEPTIQDAYRGNGENFLSRVNAAYGEFFSDPFVQSEIMQMRFTTSDSAFECEMRYILESTHQDIMILEASGKGLDRISLEEYLLFHLGIQDISPAKILYRL